MSERVNKSLPLFVLTALGIVFISLFYGKILVSPNSYMFSSSGDGMKNYFTYAYHIKYDSTFTNFEGMNYPYGENYLYTDCQPILANFLKLFSSQSPFIETHLIGIVNLLMILSILFTLIVVYLLLVELKLNKWFAILFSLGITLLAPQLFRMGGHLALSYSVAIPLSWLLTLKCIQNAKKIYFISLFGTSLFWMFIHAYLGIIVISFVFSILLVNFIGSKKKETRKLDALGLLVGAVLPVVIFFAYTALTDNHTGRTNNPSGFFLYNAELDDVFIPSGKPFRPLLDNLTGGIIKLEWEAMGYVGMINSLFFIALLFISIASIFNKKAKTLLQSFFNNRLINTSLIAATIVLLFALAIPFKQIPNLLEMFPVFKQFRATGRFIWPFYFAFTVFTAYVFSGTLTTIDSTKAKKIYTVVFIAIYSLLMGMEGYHYHKHVSKRITRSGNVFCKKQLPKNLQTAIDKIEPDKYQAIISLPFYYQGSESFGRPRNDDAVRNSLIFSYHTGIPNVCANLTRTSIEESKKIVQIVTPNFYSKPIINDISSTLPFLVIKSSKNLTEYELPILKKGKSLYVSENFELHEITPEELFADESANAYSDYKEKLPHLFNQGAFLLSDSSSVLYYNGFENYLSDTSFRGHGAFSSTKKEKNIFAEFHPNTFEKEKEYHLSMWMFNGEPDALNLWFQVRVEEFDHANNQWHITQFFPEQSEVINGNWTLVEGVFKVTDPNNTVYIVSKGKENSKATLHADDLLIKENGVDIYRMNKQDNTLFYNNHKVSLP